jgi:tryptophan synthase alpha chain
MNTGPQAIAEAFAKTRREGRAALLICLPAVGRNPEWVREAAVAAVAAGADMLEFQTRAPMPPSIALEYAPVISQSVDVPLLLWADAQTVVHFGADSPHPLADACQTAGISGIASPISGPAHFMWASGPSRDEVAPISFVTTGMDEMSFKMSCRLSRGFVYAVGGRDQAALPPVGLLRNRQALREAIRQHTDLPVVLGSGISTAEQAASAAEVFEGVAVAAAVTAAISAAEAFGSDPIAAMAEVVTSVRAGLGG